MPSPRHPSRRALFALVCSGAAGLLASLCGLRSGTAAVVVPASPVLEEIVYTFDREGNLVSTRQFSGTTQTYSYHG